MKRLVLCSIFAIQLSCVGGVGPARRAKLADPMMQFSEDSLETHRKQKLESTREGAAGGDGAAAGGGCACQ